MTKSQHTFAVGDIVFTWQYAWSYGVRKMIVREIMYGKRPYLVCEVLDYTGPKVPGKMHHMSVSAVHKSFAIAERRAKKVIDNMRDRASNTLKKLERFVEQCDVAEKAVGDMVA